MSYLKFIGKRFLYMLLMMLGVAALMFVLTHVVPSDPASANLSQSALSDEEVVAAFNAKWGLDKPLGTQFWLYLKQLCRLDFGTSIRTGNDVLQDLKKCFPATMELSLFALVIACVIGISLGIVSALKRNGIVDQSVRVLSVIGISVPSFWLSLVFLLWFYAQLHIAPGSGRLSSGMEIPATVTGMYTIDALIAGDFACFRDALAHLVLPSFVLAAMPIGVIAKQTRSNLLDVLSTDYIRTAKAKGLPTGKMIFGHALGNALIPIITTIGLVFGSLLGGSVLVEQLFSFPGMGQYAYVSIQKMDYPAIIGVTVIIAGLYLIINTVVDMLYGVIDPRIRLK